MRERISGKRLGKAVGLALSTGLIGAASASAATLDVTPNTNLPNTAPVSASGTGWGALGFVSFSQCKSDLSACRNLPTAGLPDAGGNFTTSLTLTRVFTPDAPPGPAVDCFVTPCVVYAKEFPFDNPTATAPVSFSGLPPAAPPLAATTPAATTRKKCKKGRKLKRGKCVKKKKK